MKIIQKIGSLVLVPIMSISMLSFGASAMNSGNSLRNVVMTADVENPQTAKNVITALLEDTLKALNFGAGESEKNTLLEQIKTKLGETKFAELAKTLIDQTQQTTLTNESITKNIISKITDTVVDIAKKNNLVSTNTTSKAVFQLVLSALGIGVGIYSMVAQGDFSKLFSSIFGSSEDKTANKQKIVNAINASKLETDVNITNSTSQTLNSTEISGWTTGVTLSVAAVAYIVKTIYDCVQDKQIYS